MSPEKYLFESKDRTIPKETARRRGRIQAHIRYPSTFAPLAPAQWYTCTELQIIPDTFPAPPANEKLFDPSVNTVFPVNDPPRVMLLPLRVNPFANERTFSKSVPAVATDNIPDVDFTSPVPKLDKL